MTTAPTPEEVHALAARLEHCVAKWGKQNALSLEAYSAVKMMRRLQASYQALQTENERLRMELVAEARAAAEQKLRADQLAQQHRMQAQMHAQATQQLAELEARKPPPLSDEQIEGLREQTFSTNNPFCPCDSKTMRKAVRAAERAHGIKEP
ncbi:hypothetical protein [Delftia acidovorans]|uniref:hypothetical protein n=1 Tax=Delftia acidovorans TaxID=80866 RepID=UPI0028A800F2|nr:hypothetical protein [Delftia acidovorans]